MPGLKDLLKKKERISQEVQTGQQPDDGNRLPVPEFTFIRSTTESEEIIQPPTHPDDEVAQSRSSKEKRRTLGFLGSSNASTAKDLPPAAQTSSQQLPIRPRGERRLSERLHLHRRDRSRSASVESSTNLPQDLPDAPEAVAARSKDKAKVVADEAEVKASKEQQEQREAQWEKRATILAMSSPFREGQPTASQQETRPSRSRSPSISDATGDVNIQEAIRLHEAGDLKRSTEMFGALANPKGANNALSQVLYGLALRHGWGIPIEPEKAIHYLSLAASNSASIEEQALASGLNKGGSAKGELVLAIFELANCFRNGWGVKKDSVAARQYYETAANLGDTDAMEEAAWCYLEGFGGNKDKFKAAQYLRLAEEKGSKSVAQSWIWKEKYNPK
ncbi:Putative tetratricopeptide-like helical domain superfamily [Septoria linicola]|uniref:Tetratricopeptide-like helical domain superfamily n=1 Tax=Septoria linicola TaxID=215465 RepID=A0A9Q9ACI0_9PEZI|nr:putative tetratricopeptide-like helical domain superfamily [Septoria linicola]USW47029.1 Putative tetratricopeptide-like helical domain superfamily [Septoria linicola]